MELVTTKELLSDAYRNKYAVPAINVSNMESTMALLEKASELRSPIIVQVAPIQVKVQQISYELIVELIKLIAKNYQGKYSIHLDHGEIEDCKKALTAGFTSIMFDGSLLSYEDNLKYTKEIEVECLAKGISLEAELGAVSGNEGTASSENLKEKANFTDLNQATDFVNNTSIDMLAVAIGNAHGFYKSEPKLEFDLLSKINNVLKMPLVLHGASGISEEDIKLAIANGVSKINFFTEVDQAFTNSFYEYISENYGSYMMNASEYARQQMMNKIDAIIKMCGSEGKI